MNLCVICKKRNSCKIKENIQLETSKAAEDLLPGAKVNVAFDRCSIFERDKKTPAEVEHICFNCSHSGTCDLWDQVCNIDEDFIKDAFDYDSSIQSVCSTVSYCGKFTPTKNKQRRSK